LSNSIDYDTTIASPKELKDLNKELFYMYNLLIYHTYWGNTNTVQVISHVSGKLYSSYKGVIFYDNQLYDIKISIETIPAEMQRVSLFDSAKSIREKSLIYKYDIFISNLDTSDLNNKTFEHLYKETVITKSQVLLNRYMNNQLFTIKSVEEIEDSLVLYIGAEIDIFDYKSFRYEINLDGVYQVPERLAGIIIDISNQLSMFKSCAKFGIMNGGRTDYGRFIEDKLIVYRNWKIYTFPIFNQDISLNISYDKIIVSNAQNNIIREKFCKLSVLYNIFSYIKYTLKD